ncbi:MAG: ParB/RepB/Spo0J family partition protein [Polyangiaceae bacterium]|nr:ParB/RepB/Spo0J family partition protein [Polyangiaceae bacterium]
MSFEKKARLGRGLDALIPSASSVSTPSGINYGDKSVFTCSIEFLQPQKGQPRQRIDDTRLNELAESIKEHGLLEPLVVRRNPTTPDRFEIIAGERRWRAAQRAGLKELLVVVKDVSPNAAFELALIENIQREDLDPIELAEAIERLIHEHGFTHETVANRLHKDRSTITNALRLLKLPSRVRTMVVEGKLSEGHARALLGATDPESIEQLADKAVRGKLSVRKVEALVKQRRNKGAASNNPSLVHVSTNSKTANSKHGDGSSDELESDEVESDEMDSDEVESGSDDSDTDAADSSTEDSSVDDLDTDDIGGRKAVAALTQTSASKRTKAASADPSTKNPNLRDLEQRLCTKFGRRVSVTHNRGKGEVTMSYASLDDLDDLLCVLGVS